MYTKELEYLDDERRNAITYKEDLIAENYGLLALLKICENENYKNNYLNNKYSAIDNFELNEKISKELPENIAIYSNLSKQIIKREIFKKKLI